MAKKIKSRFSLSQEDRQFVSIRSKFVRFWPAVGCVILVALLVLTIWLFVSKPLLANPLEVFGLLAENDISDADMALMAAILPIVVLLSLGLTLIMILLTFAAFFHEKKYLAIIEKFVPDALPDTQKPKGKNSL
jgi:hypothetical protein